MTAPLTHLISIFDNHAGLRANLAERPTSKMDVPRTGDFGACKPHLLFWRLAVDPAVNSSLRGGDT
jgi:hypothetical protein